MSIDESHLEAERALVFLDRYGETQMSLAEMRWGRFAYSIDGVAEWVTADEDLLDGADPDDCITALVCTVTGDLEEEAPLGYRAAYSWLAGEHECPWCGDSYQFEGSPAREECKLCEGDGLLYWGEEWRAVVFAPAWRGRQVRSDLADKLMALAEEAKGYNPAEITEPGTDGPAIDARCYLRPDGSWDFQGGDVQFDQDGRGYCGAGCAWPDMTREEAESVAEEMLDELGEQAAQDAAIDDRESQDG